MPHQGDLTILVTGANSGLGLSLCLRLCTDFLNTKPSPSKLTLIFTTRSPRKSESTLQTILSHCSSNPRIALVPELVDLASATSVLSLCRRLPPLDIAILNAGMGDFTGLNWPSAIWQVCTNLVHAVTYPDYKLQAVGRLTADGATAQVFAANVLGHYTIVQMCQPRRAIWISSLEAYAWTFDAADLEGRSASHSYEASKRLTDIVGLSPSREWSGRMFVAHPGICATSIVELPWVLALCMTMAFYVARLLGSGWHCVSSWKGARAPVRIALLGEEETDGMTGKKWGSGTDWFGREVIRETPVERKEEIPALAERAWRELEELRRYWAERAMVEGQMK